MLTIIAVWVQLQMLVKCIILYLGLAMYVYDALLSGFFYWIGRQVRNRLLRLHRCPITQVSQTYFMVYKQIINIHIFITIIVCFWSFIPPTSNFKNKITKIFPPFQVAICKTLKNIIYVHSNFMDKKKSTGRRGFTQKLWNLCTSKFLYMLPHIVVYYVVTFTENLIHGKTNPLD